MNDEAMVTGESMSVRKRLGDALIGGTVNVGAPLWLRATAVGADSALQAIARLVEDTQVINLAVKKIAVLNHSSSNSRGRAGHLSSGNEDRLFEPHSE